MELNKDHGFTLRVYVEDTDIMGIVYHANYLNFFERARTEMLRDNGLSLTMMAGYGTHFAIHDVQLCYVYPAKLDDVLTIQTKIENTRASSLKFIQLMRNQLNEVLCEAMIQVVCVDTNLKPKRLPVEFFGGIKRG